MRWAGHVTCIGRTEEVLTVFWWENLRERDLLGDLGFDGRILLRWIYRKWDGRGGARTGLIWLRIETGGGHLLTW
jgi:hypothetical protein